MARTSSARIACLCSATVALVLACASVAIACVPPTIRFSPDSGTPGTEVTIAGSARVKHEITFRWNGQDGPILARATPDGTKVATTFTVPDAAPGFYLVTAVQPGNFNNTLLGRTAFEVTGTYGERNVSKPADVSGPGLMEASSGSPSSDSVLPFVVLLAAVGIVGSAGVITLGRRRPATVLTAETSE